MNPADAMVRIQDNARKIKDLLKKRPTQQTAAAIKDHAQLIERDSANLASQYMKTRGNA